MNREKRSIRFIALVTRTRRQRQTRSTVTHRKEQRRVFINVSTTSSIISWHKQVNIWNHSHNPALLTLLTKRRLISKITISLLIKADRIPIKSQSSILSVTQKSLILIQVNYLRRLFDVNPKFSSRTWTVFFPECTTDI